MSAPPPAPAATQDDLACPVCDYSLRGLTRHVCPECGAPFDLALLLDKAAAARAGLLFEHGPRLSAKRFLWTHWHSARCGPLWRRIDPSHDIRVGRLAAYWALTLLAALAIAGAGGWAVSAICLMANDRAVLFGQFIAGSLLEQLVATAVMFWPLALWAPLSLLALAVLRTSLGRAKVRREQALRLVTYSADGLLALAMLFPLHAIIVYGLGSPRRGRWWGYEPSWLHPGSDAAMFLALAPLLFVAWGAARMAWGAMSYLKVPGLAWDVLLSQLVAALAVLTAMAACTPWLRELAFSRVLW